MNLYIDTKTKDGYYFTSFINLLNFTSLRCKSYYRKINNGGKKNIFTVNHDLLGASQYTILLLF